MVEWGKPTTGGHMSIDVKELTDKVWRSITQDTADPNEVGALITVALDLNDNNTTLTQRVRELEQSLAIAKESLERASAEANRLRSAIDKYDHLAQFAEEVVE
jgi:predicted peptidase